MFILWIFRLILQKSCIVCKPAKTKNIFSKTASIITKEYFCTKKKIKNQVFLSNTKTNVESYNGFILKVLITLKLMSQIEEIQCTPCFLNRFSSHFFHIELQYLFLSNKFLFYILFEFCIINALWILH